MKIERVDVFQVDLPYAGGIYRLSGGRTYESFDATFVRLITDTGLEGWGESTPFGGTYIATHAKGVRAGLDDIAPAVLGMDPFNLDRVYERMDQVLLGHNHAKTPIDVACWDLMGKATGRPVYDLLGGSTGQAVPLISSIPSDTPDAMRENVAKHRAQGFKGHSVKIGTADADGGPALDAERVKACLTDRQQGEWFLVDANNGLTPEHALRFLNLLPSGLDFVLEAPCATWRETQAVRKRSHVPILLDELVQSTPDLVHAIATDACDGVGIKISKQGGLTPSRTQRDLCVSSGLVASIQDTVGSEIAFAAILHLAQSTPQKTLRMALDTRSMVSQSVAAFDAPILNGGVTAPSEPGLGIKPDMQVMGDPVQVYKS